MAYNKKRGKKDKRSSLSSTSNTKTHRIIFFSLFVFTFILYGNTLNHGYALDDDVVYGKNRFVQQGIDGIGDIVSYGFLYGFNNRNNQSYRPLTLINFAIEKEIFGNNPKANHFFNVLFYAIGNVLLFLLLSKLFKNYTILIPLLISVLFISHPIHTEVVANITSRTEILSFLFGVLSLNFLMDYHNKQKAKFLLYGSLSYFLCLISKENGITLIAVVPLILYFFTERSLMNIFRLTIPYLGVVFLYLIIRNNVLDTLVFGEDLDIINNSLRGAGNVAERYATNFVILGEYLYLLFIPHPLSWDYSYNQFPIVNFTDIKAIASLIIYIALGIYCIIGIRRKDAIAFGILFFLITLSVTSNLFILIGATLGERFLFTPSLGFCIVIVILLAKILKIDPLGKFSKNRSKLITIIIVITALFSIKTIDRNKDWKDNFSLFSADINSCPNSARNHFALASAYRVDGERERNAVKRNSLLTKAVEGFKKSVEIYPEFTAAWYNMGVTYYANQQEDKALFAYQKAIEADPGYQQALNNMGVIYFNRKNYDIALKHFLAAVQSNPDYGDPYANIGAVYHNTGKHEQAIENYEKALQYNPNNRNVNNNLAKLYNSMGDVEKAKYYSQRAGIINN
ncbi:MAG: tetratricopeptide repeat protein [Bacteroidota bacterium]